MVKQNREPVKVIIKSKDFYGLVNQIKIGFQQHKKWIYVENSAYTKKSLEILKQTGLVIASFEFKSYCKFVLCYSHLKKPPFSTFNLLSKPTQKNYWTIHQIKANTFGSFHGRMFILVTRSGLVTNHDAIKLNIGGEVLCEIY